MPAADHARATARILDRYVIYDRIASGGMARVHLGRLLGPVGFARTVAIKCLHAQYAENPDFVSMFVDEARLAARIRHPNVVPTLDVIAADNELYLVMDYVHGETLARLSRMAGERGQRIPPRIATAIVAGALHGLHAAHEATDESGKPLGIIHRDVSPQNILVGTDGVARVLDFGVAKAAARVQSTRDGELKGKIAYMAPEQLTGKPVDRRTDLFAAAIVLWEALAGERLFGGDNEGQVVEKVLTSFIDAPSQHAPGIDRRIDEITLKGLERNVQLRYATAKEMARDLERGINPALPSEIGEWVDSIARDGLSARSSRIAEIESGMADRASHAQQFLGNLPANKDTIRDITSPMHSAPSTLTAPQATAPNPSSIPTIADRIPLHVPSPEDSNAPSTSTLRSSMPQVSTAISNTHETPRKLARVVAATFGVVVAATALAVWLAIGKFHAPDHAATTSPTTSGIASTISRPLNVADNEPGAVPTSGANDVPAGVASTAGSAATESSAHRIAAPRATAKKGAPAASCNPPYLFDAMGHKVYKPECPLE